MKIILFIYIKMDLIKTLKTLYNSQYESNIYISSLDNKIYSKLEYTNKNISFPINIISNPKIKKCAILIIINSGYIIEILNTKFENYIKLILELFFKCKNDFNQLFSRYNLKYENKIYSEKTVIYMEFDYLGFNPIFSKFVKNIIYFDRLVVQNNINDILKNLNIVNNIDTDYLYNKYFIKKHFEISESSEKNKEMSLNEFFQYYFLKNREKYITILSPYSEEKSKDIISKIFDKNKNDFKNNLLKIYDKYTPLIPKFCPFIEPDILLIRKLDIEKNNNLKLKFFFPELSYKSQNILEYISYMINGKRPGSIFYHLNRNRHILDLYSYTIYNINMPPQLIISMRVNLNFSQYILKLILSKFINFLRKLLRESNNIKITYENYQKMLLHNFNYSNNNNKNYYFYLYEFTNNFIELKKINNDNNSDNQWKYATYMNLLLNRYLLPEYNFPLVKNIIDDIMSLKNLIIIMELHPKLFSNFSINIKGFNNIISNKNIVSNDYNTYYYLNLNKTEILNYSFTTQNYDSSSFKHKQNKINYISKEINLSSIPNNFNNRAKVQLYLNNIANQLWYYIPEENHNINNFIVYSKFHFINPNIRNINQNINKTQIKYYNYTNKKIEQEFEEILDMGNIINLTMDKNGINLELKAFKDIYIKILEKIFSFFFEFENDFIEYGDVDYISEDFKSDLDKAINCLQSALKEDLNEKYFEGKNYLMDVNKLKLYGFNLEDNIYIESLIYGNMDMNLIKDIKNVFLKYNTREYDYLSIFGNIAEFKKKILETKKIKEGGIYIYKLGANYLEHNINYYYSFFQILDFNKEKYIYLILIYLLMKKNLNSRSCTIHKIHIDEIYYISIIRKSFDYPELMAKHVTVNIKKLIDIICKNNSDESDNTLKQILLNLKNDFLEEIIDEDNIFNFFWDEIYNSTYNFDFEIKDEKSFINYIENKIDLIEFKNYFKNNFFEKQRKIEFLYYKDSIKYYNTATKKDLNSYPWNIDFINNNNEFKVYEIYYNISKLPE